MSSVWSTPAVCSWATPCTTPAIKGLAVEFPPIPRFSPRGLRQGQRPIDNGRFKQFPQGVLPSSTRKVSFRCCVIPTSVKRRRFLPRVGELQFEVFAYRLGSEFGAPTEILSAAVPSHPPDRQGVEARRLRRIGGIRILTRGDGALVALFEKPLSIAAAGE